MGKKWVSSAPSHNGKDGRRRRSRLICCCVAVLLCILVGFKG